jgi:xylulokinase
LATDHTHLQKSTFFGLDLSHDRFHMIRAIMEGIAFQIVWMLGHFRSKPSKRGLILAGGASKSALWCQIVADIANLPVRIPEVPDLACVGAAILAGVGCGLYKDMQEGYKAFAVPERVILPNPEQAEKYRSRFKHYQQIAALMGQAEQ